MTYKTTGSAPIKTLFFTLLLSLFLLPAPACSTETPAENAAPGREQLKLNELSQQLAKDPENPTLLYNYGVALYQAKQYQQAAENFAGSSRLEPDTTQQAAADYNQGRALFAQAQMLQSPQETGTRKALLQRAGAAFQQALEHNPKLNNARQGLLEYRKEMEKIRERENREKKEGNKNNGKKGDNGKSEDKKNIRQKLEQAAEKQQDLSRKNTDGQDTDQQARQQEALRKQLEELQKKLQKDKNNTDLAKQLQKAVDKQKQAEQALKKGQPDKAKEQQQEAAKALQQAARQDKQEPARNTAPQDMPDQQELLPQEEQPVPEMEEPSLAKDILENERKLHELRRLQMRKARPYHGKDW
jgi:hypothetical protein